MAESFSRREFLIAVTAAAGGLGLAALAGARKETGDQARAVLSSETGEGEVKDSDYAEAVRRVKESVFKIKGPMGHGSGFLVAPGFLVTNRHVVEGDNEYRMETDTKVIPWWGPVPLPPLNITAINDPNYRIQSYETDDRNPQKEFRAGLVHLSDGSRAWHKDLALLQVPANAELPGKPVTIGTPQLGRPVIVMGNPHDQVGHTTFGRVSKDVVFDKDNEKWKGVPFVGTDAPINPGNSGGAMFQIRRQGGELKVELVGVPTYAYRNSDGMGGAIRADYLAWICTVKWGLKLLSPEQVEAFKKAFPTAE